MKNIWVIITIGTIYAVFFQVAVSLNLGDGLIFTLFSGSPFLIIYMAYMILKYGKPSTSTFDEKFYDDLDYQRNGEEEMFPAN
jgi:hypothetical protein